MQDTREIELSLISYLINVKSATIASELKPEYFTSLERERASQFLIENIGATVLEVKASSGLGLSEITFGGAFEPVNEYEARKYIATLKENYIKRRISQIELRPDAKSVEIIVQLQREIDELTRESASPSGEMFEARRQAIDLASDSVRYRFELPTLDRAVQFRRGGVYVIGGRPASGKSYLALQFALVQALSNVPTLFISTELSSGMNFIRLQNLYMGFDPNVNQQEAGDILEGVSTLLIHDTIVSVDGILHEVRKQVAKKQIQVVVIDHIQEISNDNGADELRAFEDILTQLRIMAMEKNLCIVLVSQLNKEGGFKGASKIQEVASGALILTRDTDSIWLEVTKNRNGQRPKEPLLIKQEWPSGMFSETRGQAIVSEFGDM
jgi:KaiC/GvpD/RAD55 family RecA-like ATPase